MERILDRGSTPLISTKIKVVIRKICKYNKNRNNKGVEKED